MLSPCALLPSVAPALRSFTHPGLVLGLLLAAWAPGLHAQVSTSKEAASTMDPYRDARTPVVSFTLGTPTVAKGTTAKLAKLNALAGGTASLIQPQVHGGVFDEVSLGYLAGNKQAIPPASVTLQFSAARAGATVWVQPLDGGAILTQDADGKPISKPEGYNVVLDASGRLTFSYQALAHPGRYQVLIRLDNVSSVLPFVILDPSVDN